MSDLDRELADRLERLAAAVPVRAGSLDPVHVGAVQARQQVRMRWLTPFVALVVVLLLAGLVGVGGLNLVNGPISATTRQGDFELAITSAKARYRPGEAISIEGSLTYRGTEPSVRVGDSFGSGGEARLVHFGVTEPVPVDGGTIELSGGVSRLVCDMTEMHRDTPRIASFVKAGGTSLPIADAWFKEPLRLTPGTWHPYAQARVGLGGCAETVDLRVQLEITVAGSEVTAGPSDPAPSFTEAALSSMDAPSPAPTLDASAPASSPVATPGPLWHGGPVVAGIVSDDLFELQISTQKGTFAPDEAIEIHVQVTYIGAAATIDMWSSDPPVTYEVEQLDGPHAAYGGASDVCQKTVMFHDTAQDFAFNKSIGFSADDPDLPWIKAYLADPDVHLTTGTWRLSANLEASVGACGGKLHRLGASIVIAVQDPAALTTQVQLALATATPMHADIGGQEVDLCPTALSGGVLARNPRTGLGFSLGIGPVLDVVWPAGYTAWIEDGVAVLRNGAGAVVAREGDEVLTGGGGLPDGRWFSCSVGVVSPTGTP